jgi:S1-C subfamily serine protease
MKSATRPAKKPASSGIPVVWLVTAVLFVFLFIGGVVGGLMWMVQKATVISDPPPPALPPTPAAGGGFAGGPAPGGPAGPTFEGTDGDPHEVPAGPFPPAGFPPRDSFPSEHALHAVRNPVPGAGGGDEKNPPTKPTRISPEARAAVKNGTVYIRVTRTDGGGSGSGFFAAADAPNLVVTNAHVVGMLESGKPEPTRIEVFVNSGQKNEKKYAGKVLGVDRSSDLAVIDIGVKEGLPPPLKVGPAASVQELDEVYVFGFPLGERLGKEITIRDTTVSSLRKRDGVLERIQTKGGMDPGNSGGPVVDTNGHLVGVSVAGMPGREINFAIPSDRVHGILHGRMRGFGIGHPIKKGDKIMAPVRIETIDPSGQIKEAGVEVWTGNPPAGADRTRPASSSPPAAQPGDSPRKRTARPIEHHEGDKLQSTRGYHGEIELPPLPVGKVYWVQPIWVHRSGETFWGSASVYSGGQPLLPKSIDLHARFQAGQTKRRVHLAVGNRIYSDDEESERRFGTSATTAVGFSERVVDASPSAATLALFYQGAARLIPGKNAAQEDQMIQSVRANLKVMKARLQLEPNGNLTTDQFIFARSAPRDDSLRSFHDSIKPGLDSTYLPLPNRTVKPGDTWEAKRMLTLTQGLMSGRNVQLDMTCTYLGARTNKASREEAVVSLSGQLNTGSPGRMYGEMVVDVATGIIRSVELNLGMNLSDALIIGGRSSRSLRLYLWMTIQLQRDL